MATNAEETAVDDSKEVTEDDLRDLKYGSADVETSKEEDETEETNEDTDDSEETGEEAETNSDDQAEETEETDEESDDSVFVKKFPNIKGDSPEEYARNLEAAYENSTTEFHRLRQTQVADKDDTTEEETKVDTSDPISLYMKQKMDEEITNAYGEFSKHYSQVNDQGEYAKFTRTVATLSNTILQSEKRLAPPKELYSKAAVILGWEPEGKVDSKDKLGNALKDRAAVSKTSTAATKKVSKSKVTDAMVAANRLMYPDKTDAQIREELEPYVQ